MTTALLRRIGIPAIGGLVAAFGLPGCAGAAEPAVHVFLNLALSSDAATLATVEGDMPISGGRPVIRDLVLRHLPSGDATKIDLPCGAVAQCWPDAPAWSPDGKHLTFALRKPGSHARSIYQLNADGSGLTELVSFGGTIIDLKYSRDGRLAVLATESAKKEVGAVEAGAPVTGDADDAPAEQRIAILDHGALTWSSPADLFVYEYDWLPDGSGFVGTAAAGDGDNNWWVAKLYGFNSAGARVLYAPADRQHQIAAPLVSNDGNSVYFISGLMSDFGSTGGDIYRVPAGGGGATDLTPAIAASATELVLGCNGTILAETLHGDRVELVSLDGSSGPTAGHALWSGPESIGFGRHSFACTDGGTSAVVRQSFTAAPELAFGPIGQWRAVTHVNTATGVNFTAQSVSWKSDSADAQGWLLLPKSPAKAESLPMITLVHGGPSAAVTPRYPFPLVRKLLDQGYALFLPNPRGSFGQGTAFQAANYRDLGYGDLKDILAGIDAVEKQAPIDDTRLGIMGHSYGGFMTMWTVTQTNRFKAAVASAGVANWQSYYGENGIDQWMIPFFGQSVYDDPAAYARSSPINFIKQVRTPTFVWVGENDVECPAPQTQEFWHALHALNVPTSMMIYPNEGHAMVDPEHIADAERRTLAWFDKYLK
jgi:dipeptidyl aminopeptidase/acylaminoacyl peptidase